MATASTEKKRTEEIGSHTVSSAVQHESSCTRCGGLMVQDFCLDVLGNFGESEFAAQRCVQCGEVVDSVIVLNRQLRKATMTVQIAGKMVPDHRATNGRGGFALQTHGTGFRCVRDPEGQAQQK